MSCDTTRRALERSELLEDELRRAEARICRLEDELERANASIAATAKRADYLQEMGRAYKATAEERGERLRAAEAELKALREAVETAARESSLCLFAGRPDSETLIDLRAKLRAALETKP